MSSHPPGDLPDPGIKSKSFVSPVLRTNSLPAEPSGKPKIFYMKKHISKLSMEDSRSLPDKSQGLLDYFPDLCYTFSGFLAGPGQPATSSPALYFALSSALIMLLPSVDLLIPRTLYVSKIRLMGNSLVVQWLGLQAFTAEGLSWRTNPASHMAWPRNNNNDKASQRKIESS